MAVSVKATRRNDIGTRKVRRLREKGLIPGVIYGHGQDAESITLQKHEVELAILHGERLLEITCEESTQNVLIKEVQYDTFGQKVLHLDLTRVNLDERVEVTVPIILRGTPEGVTADDGILQQALSEIQIECTVQSIPEEIVVMVTEMKVGDRLLVGDLPLGDGTKLLGDPGATVAIVRIVTEEVVEEEAPAEPDVIGEVKEEGEEPAT